MELPQRMFSANLHDELERVFFLYATRDIKLEIDPRYLIPYSCHLKNPAFTSGKYANVCVQLKRRNSQ